MHLVDEMPQHRLGDLEVRNDPVLQRPDGHDVAGGAPEHPLRLVAHGQHVIRPRPHRHHRGLAQDDAVIFYINQGVRRPEIDADIVREHPENSVKHSK